MLEWLNDNPSILFFTVCCGWPGLVGGLSFWLGRRSLTHGLPRLVWSKQGDSDL